MNAVYNKLFWLSICRPSAWIVADMGCGAAELATRVKQTVHSFDLVALNERVTVANIAKVNGVHCGKAEWVYVYEFLSVLFCLFFYCNFVCLDQCNFVCCRNRSSYKINLF